MEISQTVVVLDAADIEAVSAFWADLLGGTVSAHDDWHTVYVDGQPRLAVQLAPDHVSPDWPNGTQQIHLDLFIEDIVAAHDEALAKGAVLLQAAEDQTSPDGFQVYADPAGHPFCLCWGHG